MKLIDFITDLEKNKAVIQNAPSEGFLLDTNWLKNFESKLFECEEFKNVARINFIETPNYLVDEETGEPIATNREFLGGKTKMQSLSLFRVNPGEDLKFNKIVDLYTIRLNKRFNPKEDISKPGIWIFPTSYNKETFDAINQVRIIWEPEQLRQALQMVDKSETPKDRLMRMFESALDNLEANIPCEYFLTLRCSIRSIANSEEIEIKEA